VDSGAYLLVSYLLKLKKSYSFEIFLGYQPYRKQFKDCTDSFVNGLIHPEPGHPVQLFIVGNVTTNCTFENAFANSISCPPGVKFTNIKYSALMCKISNYLFSSLVYYLLMKLVLKFK